MNPISTIVRWVRAVVGALAGALPGPPPQDGPPPDIDGRRPTDADTTAIDVRIQEKEGKGGFR
jgi:hypothetical protein